MIYREITDIDPQDMSVDTSGTKNYSLFLTELSQLVARDMIMCVEPLTIHLGGEVRGRGRRRRGKVFFKREGKIIIIFLFFSHTLCVMQCYLCLVR